MHCSLLKRLSILLSVDIIMIKHGLNNKMCCQLQAKRLRLRCILNCHLDAFYAKKWPNNNLKGFVCILALVSVLV